MMFLSPSRHHRLNEAVGIILLLLGLAAALCLASFSAADPSWNTASRVVHSHNLLGPSGAVFSDFLFQLFGLSAYLLPVLTWALAWKWLRSSPPGSPFVKLFGSLALWLSLSAACGLVPAHFQIGGALPISGIAGMLISDFLLARFDLVGAAIATATAAVIALYLVSTFEVAMIGRWLSGPIAGWRRISARWRGWQQQRRERALARAKAKADDRAIRRQAAIAAQAEAERIKHQKRTPRTVIVPEDVVEVEGSRVDLPASSRSNGDDDRPPFDLEDQPEPVGDHHEIPIRPLEPAPIVVSPRADLEDEPDEWDEQPVAAHHSSLPQPKAKQRRRAYRLPPTDLLTEIPPGNGFDGQELKEVASRIKSKLEEFNVRGSVVQINPGPVVTTFEFKPEAGVKYSRITTLTEDLCLGLQAESVLIERLPGKPTVELKSRIPVAKSSASARFLNLLNSMRRRQK